jgi:hypothetical protein
MAAVVAVLLLDAVAVAWLHRAGRARPAPAATVPAPAPAPTPRGRCYLGPSRIRKLADADAARLCAREPYGCVRDNLGTAYAVEEPLAALCVAPGDGR